MALFLNCCLRVQTLRLTQAPMTFFHTFWLPVHHHHTLRVGWLTQTNACRSFCRLLHHLDHWRHPLFLLAVSRSSFFLHAIRTSGPAPRHNPANGEGPLASRLSWCHIKVRLEIKGYLGHLCAIVSTALVLKIRRSVFSAAWLLQANPISNSWLWWVWGTPWAYLEVINNMN